MGHNDVHNGQDIIDSRDIIARIEELEGYEQEALDQANIVNVDAEGMDDPDDAEDHRENGLWTASGGEVYGVTDDWDDITYDELKALRSLAEEAEGCGDWYDGATLIKASYFETYAEDLAQDIGAIDRNARWPLSHIDWAAAAEELKQDYTEVDYDGVLYYVRD